MSFVNSIMNQGVLEGNFIATSTLEKYTKKKKEDSFQITLVGCFGEWTYTLNRFDEIDDGCNENCRVVSMFSVVHPFRGTIYITHLFLLKEVNRGSFKAILNKS